MVMMRPTLTLAALLLLAPALCAQTQAPPPWIRVTPPPEPVYPQISVMPEEVRRSGAVPVDARGPGSGAERHIPGAIRLDLGACGEADSACLQKSLGRAGISGDTPLVVYGETLEEAALTFFLLEAAGCRNVRVLEGGLDAWTAAGFPVETGAFRKRPEQGFSAAEARTVTIAPEEQIRRLGDLDFVVLDVRDSGDWTQNGYEAPRAYRAGHVPRSLPWDPRSVLTRGDGRLPDPQAGRTAFLQLGARASARIPPHAEVAVYGEGAQDSRAALAYLVLRTVGFAPRVLPGGFSGWQTAGRPVARIVEPAEVQALLAGERAVAVDLREAYDFAAGHVPGAALLPIHRIFGELDTTVRALRPSFDAATDPLILYCYGRDCIRSHEAAATAAQAGFRQILWFRDGMEAWRAGGYPVAARPAEKQNP